MPSTVPITRMKGHESSIGVGLIGLGRHGSRYAKHLVNQIEGAHLAAVCRRDPSLGSSVETPTPIPCHGNFRALVADPRVDAIVVVTAPVITRAIALEAAGAKKPLLIEKPLATTSEDARAIVEAAEAAGIVLMTAHTLRFEPVIVRLKQTLSHVGTCRYVTLTSRIEPRTDGGLGYSQFGNRGILLETGIHLLDLVRFVTGHEVREVRCEMDVVPPKAPESRVVITLRTFGGIDGLLEISRLSPGRVTRAECGGEAGQLIADWQTHTLTKIPPSQHEDIIVLHPQPTVVAILQAFIDAVRLGTDPPITGTDGLKAVELADACYRSASEGSRSVTLPLR